MRKIINKNWTMRKLIMLCLMIAGFNANAQTEAELISWLNAEASNIDMENSNAVGIESGSSFEVSPDAILMSGNSKGVFRSSSDLNIGIDKIDAILYKRSYQGHELVHIFFNQITNGKQEHIELRFPKEKPAKKYAEKLIQFVKLKNVPISPMPDYMPSIKEIAEYLKPMNDENMELQYCYSSIVPQGEGNELEITDKHIKLYNRGKGLQHTIVWSEMPKREWNATKTVIGPKTINGEPEFIQIKHMYKAAEFLKAMYLIESTNKGVPATQTIH